MFKIKAFFTSNTFTDLTKLKTSKTQLKSFDTSSCVRYINIYLSHDVKQKWFRIIDVITPV